MTAVRKNTQTANEDRDEYETPDPIFRMYDAIWHFTIDAAATEANTKCDRYFDKELNGLLGDYWDERVWNNPPWSDPQPWIEKAAKASRDQRALWFLYLAPIVDVKAFHEYVWDGQLWQPRPGVEVNFGKGRTAFLKPDGRPAKNPPSGNMMILFHPNGVTDGSFHRSVDRLQLDVDRLVSSQGI